MPGGKAGLHLVQPLADRLLDRERVRAGARVQQHERRGHAVQSAFEVVAARAEHRLADVAQAHDRAVGPRADDDVVELLGRLQPPERRDRQRQLRARRRRLGAESAGGIRGVLLAHRGRDVAHRDPELRHLLGIELEQHREVARRKRRRVADAGDALQLVDDEQLHVVREIRRVVPRVARLERDDGENVGVRLEDRDAVRPHRVGQLRLGELHGVLHVDRGEILVARDVERDRDGRSTRRSSSTTSSRAFLEDRRAAPRSARRPPARHPPTTRRG